MAVYDSMGSVLMCLVDGDAVDKVWLPRDGHLNSRLSVAGRYDIRKWCLSDGGYRLCYLLRGHSHAQSLTLSLFSVPSRVTSTRGPNSLDRIRMQPPFVYDIQTSGR